jgi:hypothetical protein
MNPIYVKIILTYNNLIYKINRLYIFLNSIASLKNNRLVIITFLQILKEYWKNLVFGSDNKMEIFHSFCKLTLLLKAFVKFQINVEWKFIFVAQTCHQMVLNFRPLLNY